METINKILILVSICLLVSCNNQTSLQQYFVNHQEDIDFIAVDIPSSILAKEGITFSEEEKDALESIKKINFLALPLKEGTKDRIAKESSKINAILDSESYQTLMKLDYKGTKVVLKYYGDDEDTIDEAIVFANDQNKGMGVIRVLGDDMKPEKIIKLVKSLEKGNINLDGLKRLAKFFE